MKKPREATWDDYGISKNRLAELQAFCLQFKEKKRLMATCAEKTLKEFYLHDLKMIEQAAIAACPDNYRFILKSVAEGLSFEKIEFDRELGRISMCKADFYAYRRLFFHYLNQLQIRNKIEKICNKTKLVK